MTDAKWLCPDCGNAALSFGRGVELPADRWSDEISLSQIFCTACPFQGVAVYRESRRGALDSESWQLAGYHATDDVYATLLRTIAECSDPGKRSCGCPSHILLGVQDVNGVWNWLEKTGIDMARSFPIREPGPLISND